MNFFEKLTFSVDNNVCKADKKISINFTKANTKCFLSLHYNGYESDLYVNNNGYENYLFVNKTETCKFKALDTLVSILFRMYIKRFYKTYE